MVSGKRWLRKEFLGWCQRLKAMRKGCSGMMAPIVWLCQSVLYYCRTWLRGLQLKQPVPSGISICNLHFLSCTRVVAKYVLSTWTMSNSLSLYMKACLIVAEISMIFTRPTLHVHDLCTFTSHHKYANDD
ncbi:uncharacterized protein LOC131333346 [Rhododendron vialii]|uniref:uncharacterized protein LOC131333346 n=1 Tax=Rhododendron vialii TaxID=182163 RepID=UPI00265E61F8|nr:uncharacterized protein LOC131333346 [Rhododendron vialii]